MPLSLGHVYNTRLVDAATLGETLLVDVVLPVDVVTLRSDKLCVSDLDAEVRLLEILI